MALTLQDVQRVADLARIEVTDLEAGQALAQLRGIFGLIEQMQSVDASGIEPMAHARDVTQRLRDDRVTEPDRHEDFQRVAPEVERGLYLVPKVIE